ncbi:hypothetical protein CSA37_00520 [Candidatus Fermentibacteria bacterium]|nr:MAG: hypothetical protein CSA37_00520 [Candidatus Fermentibacteria bacterium]
MPGDKCIVVNKIKKSYKNINAIRQNFSCEIYSGVNTVLIGKNGAGKTTLMNLITGNIFLDQGEITINGICCSKPESRRGLRYLPDNMQVPEKCTAADLFIEFQRYSSEFSMADFRATAEEFDCLHLIDHPFSKKSKGQKRLLMLSIVLSGSPSVVILDEPMEGLDPMNVRKVRRRITGLCREGCTVLHSSHRIHEAERHAERYLIIHDGEFRGEGVMADLELYRRIPEERVKHLGMNQVRKVSSIDDYCLVKAESSESISSWNMKNISSPATLEDVYIASLENL